MRFSLKTDDLSAVLKRAYVDGELAVSDAMNDVQSGLKDELRSQVVSAVMATVLIDVRVSEVPSPVSGDTAEIDGDLFDIIGTPTRDGLSLVWIFQLLLGSGVTWRA